MKPLPLPTSVYLHECFTYDPITGEVFWKERPRHHFEKAHGWNLFNAKFAGKVAGHHHKDRLMDPSGIRICFTINGNRGHIYAHRIIYGLMGIEVPGGWDVDHKDTDPYNNSWLNLRLATKAQNARNRKGWRDRKIHLPKGVFVSGNKFGAQINILGTNTHIGLFDTPALAHEAYCAAAEEHHGDFARFNSGTRCH